MNIFIYRLTIMLFYTIVLSACNDLNNVIFEPQFKVAKDSVYVDIYRIVETEVVYIEGYKTQIEDTLDISLTVQLINAKKLPTDNDSLIDIEKKVANKVKSLLKNPFQYRTYDIIFLQRDTVNGVFGTITSEEGLYPKRFNAIDL